MLPLDFESQVGRDASRQRLARIDLQTEIWHESQDSSSSLDRNLANLISRQSCRYEIWHESRDCCSSLDRNLANLISRQRIWICICRYVDALMCLKALLHVSLAMLYLQALS